MAETPDKVLEEVYDIDNTQQQRLITVLGELEDEVEKQNSWRQVFLRGALHGLGTVIGATVLLAILGSAIALAIKAFGLNDIPFVGPFVEKIVSEQLDKRD